MKNFYAPDFLNVPFFIGICIAALLVSLFARKYAPADRQGSVFGILIGFFISYFGYIYFAGRAGLFDAVSLPPRILLLSTLPYALLLFLVVIKLDITQKIISNATLASLIGLHIFRLVGFIFVILALYNALPKGFAFIAGFGDVITALSSMVVVWAINNKKTYAKKLAYAWNTFGLVDIITTAVLANVLTKIAMDTGAMGVDSLAKFPFSLIPAFAPPTIIFLHVVIYQKLKNFSK